MQSSSLHWGFRLSFHKAKDGERKTDDASLQPKFFARCFWSSSVTPSERIFCVSIIVLSRKICQLCQPIDKPHYVIFSMFFTYQSKPPLFSFSFQLSMVSWDPFQGSKPLTTPNTVCWTWVTTDKKPVQCDWVSLRVDEIWTFKKTLLSFKSSHSHHHSVVPSWPNSTIGPR